MKEMMQRIMKFITFDSPLQADFISLKFASIYASQQSKLPLWNANSTRHKMISDYWFSSVIKHFLLLFTIAILITFIQTHKLEMFPVLFAGFISFVIIYFFHYKLFYTSIFLPNLEMIIEEYEQKLKDELRKCKQVQLSNFALVLIFYVFNQTNKMNSLSCDEKLASLLMKLYGIDAGSIKKNLELLVIRNKRKTLTERKKTELKNRFTEAYLF